LRPPCLAAVDRTQLLSLPLRERSVAEGDRVRGCNAKIAELMGCGAAEPD